jgi:hypothetical protein
MLERAHLLLGEPQRDASSDRPALLKPKDGLNGHPSRQLEAIKRF